MAEALPDQMTNRNIFAHLLFLLFPLHILVILVIFDVIGEFSIHSPLCLRGSLQFETYHNRFFVDWSWTRFSTIWHRVVRG